MLVFAAIVPHPIESIPQIGSPEQVNAVEKTLQSYEALRKDLEKADPNTLIIISPHAHLESYSFTVNSSNTLRGSFAQFGLDDVYEYDNNLDFSNKIAYFASMNEISVHLHESFLDHGALIPLYHLLKNIHPKVVYLSFSLMDFHMHYRYGEIIQSLIERGFGGRVAIIASADLSHKLSPDSQSGFSQNAMKFDRDILHFLGSNDEASIMNLQPDTLMEVSECGLRSIVILLGALHGYKYKFKLLSYEYPFGIGYMTARLF